MKISIPTTLKELAANLSAPIYMVGGFVRNSILFGIQDDTDMDICGPLTPYEMVAELEGVAEIREVNPRIGTVLIKYKENFFEYTTFRQDSYPIGGQHRPQEVTFVKSMASDVKRRDFTVNAVYAEVLTGEVIDLVSGVDDMKNRLLRTVRSPLETFSEDGLRLLRLVRFACELGFDIEEETERGARESATQLLDISGERKREEFRKILNSDFKYHISGKPSRGMKLLTKLNLWENLNFYQPCLKEGAKKDSEFELLDKVPKNVRLEVFAITLCEKETAKTIESVFGQDGFRHPKSVVKNLLAAVDFVRNPRDEQELMTFISKNRNLVETFDELSEIYHMGWDIKSLHAEMVAKNLPFEVKELGISDNDFIKFKVKNKERGKALDEILSETYRQKRNLTLDEKQKILMKHSEA